MYQKIDSNESAIIQFKQDLLIFKKLFELTIVNQY